MNNKTNNTTKNQPKQLKENQSNKSTPLTPAFREVAKRNSRYCPEQTAQRIKEFDPENEDFTLQELQENADRRNEIYYSTTHKELDLLWYLRNLQVGETNRFFQIARKIYELNQELMTLQINIPALPDGKYSADDIINHAKNAKKTG